MCVYVLVRARVCVCAEAKEVYDYVYFLFVISHTSVKSVFTQKLPERLSAISEI